MARQRLRHRAARRVFKVGQKLGRSPTRQGVNQKEYYDPNGSRDGVNLSTVHRSE